jgi:quercetin dioxygenase-like cupin family protein
MLKRLVPVVVAALVALSAATIACSSSDTDVLHPADGVDEIVRQIIQAGEPQSATGQDLELTRVIIPAGDEIAPHTHPGLQLAIITEGTLTYTVVDGEVTVHHNSGTDDETSETVTSGQTVDLRPGSSVMEVPGMVHQAHNDSDQAVVIYLASLFPVDADPSSPAE